MNLEELTQFLVFLTNLLGAFLSLIGYSEDVAIM